MTLDGVNQWIDLNAASGIRSVTTNSFPTIGGGSTGWTFEVIVKPLLGGVSDSWAKLFDFGSTRNPNTLASCVNDIVLGWDANNAQWQFDTCDTNNHEYQTGDAFGNINNGTWYHMVTVIAPTTNGNGLANYFHYINGVLYTTEPNMLYPQAVTRQNAWIGHSGWYSNGDLNVSAEIDTFNIYNSAVGDQQALNLYQQNFLAQTVTWSAPVVNNGGGSGKSLSGGAIAGIVIGSVAGALILLLLCWCFFMYSSRGDKKASTGGSGYDSHRDASQVRDEQSHVGEETGGEGVEMA